MNITIDSNDSSVVRITSSEKESQQWPTFCRIARDEVPLIDSSAESIAMSWQAFLSYRSELVRLAKIYRIEINIADRVKNALKASGLVSYHAIKDNVPVEEKVLLEKLNEAGFVRSLSDEQKRNVGKLAAFPACATFSVPGAGKTTEALAYYSFHAETTDKLMIVAPKNAFPAWDEQLQYCMETKEQVVRLTGGRNNIRDLLADKPKFSIIAYRQFSLVADLIIEFLNEESVFLFLDESHRIKGGVGKVTVDSVLQTSFLPKRKLILSGTPMPQAETDLNPQLTFLYPELNLKNVSAIEMIQPIYVRTTKAELGLDSPIRKKISVSLTPGQYEFYELLKSEAARQIAGITRFTRSNLRRMGKSIMKLMQFVSNPALLAPDVAEVFSPQLSSVLIDGGSIKVDYACKRARELAASGEKTIIWTSFRKNVELIAMRLEDIGADYIHGSVDAGDDGDSDTREGKIKRFHDDENAMVLVANPAAAAEGISLHTVCHTAIYVDRSFNAAHYLQSEDRIHRFGLAPGIDTNIEILECKNTIDEIINERLVEKVSRMAQALNDKSLTIDTDEYAYEEDDLFCSVGIDETDAKVILSHLTGVTND
jgi:hypothetical protein